MQIFGNMNMRMNAKLDFTQPAFNNKQQNGYMSAFLSDLGYTAEEVYRIFAILVASGVTACYVDTCNKTPDTFLPLRCSDIEYTGKLARPVP
jgi:citrate synthase